MTLLEATDANGDPITYVISDNADGKYFIIKEVPGALINCLAIEFIKDDEVIGTRNLAVTSGVRTETTPAPGNFEAPVDTGADNTYDLTITATDIHGNEVEKLLNITVQDVNEPARINTPSTISYTERQTSAVTQLQAK